jgi:hypothetical protein
MNRICAKFPCNMNMTSGYCADPYCPMKSAPLVVAPTPSPRFLPVNIPFSMFGITVVTLDGHGNVEIKVDQPFPPQPGAHVGGSGK